MNKMKYKHKKRKNSQNPQAVGKLYLIILPLYAIALSVLLFSACQKPLNTQCDIIPAPQKNIFGRGHFEINSKTRIVCAEPVIKIEAEKLQKYILDAIGKNVPIVEAGTRNVIVLETDANINESEAYQLSVERKKVICRASTPAGIFYSGQSLIQLSDPDGKIPCMNITDQPRYEWRGFMLDESRHFSGKQTVKQILDVMAYLKMNRFHWHLTDEPGWRIEIKKYPKLTETGAIGDVRDPNAPSVFYTQEEIREIIDYASERHIMVIPEIDMPGHASAANRAYPEFSSGGSGPFKDFLFNPAAEGIFDFIDGIITEIALLFPAPYIHIGGDEVHFGIETWQKNTEIQQFINDHDLKDEAGLEHYFVRRVCEIVNSKGRFAIGWDDIVDSGVTPDIAIPMWWRKHKPEMLVSALEKKFKVIMTPNIPCYVDYKQEKFHHLGPGYDTTTVNSWQDIYRFPKDISSLIINHSSQIMGIQACLWTGYINEKKHLFFNLFPRLASLAESAWTNPESKEIYHFEMKLKNFLQYLDRKGINYFNPFDPKSTPEVWEQVIPWVYD